MNPEPDTQELSRLEEVLRRPDFLLEPSCFSIICAYIKAGGTPNAIIENLTDGYVGYAHMASLMCGWMDALDNDLEGDGPSSTQPRAAANGAQQGWEGSGRQERNEFGFLKEFVRARFDPDKLSSVFMKCAGGKPPAWLDQLTSTPQGRALIYQLSAAHRNCLVLNFAIQKILVQGHEDEVASVGSSLASYFTVFHRLLATRLRAALAACVPKGTLLPWQAGSKAGEGGPGDSSAKGGGGPVAGTHTSVSREASPAPRAMGAGASQVATVHSLQQLSRELVDSCAHAGHTYLHAQQLLGAAAEHPKGGPVFERLSQDLQAATTALYPAAWGTMRMLLPPNAPPALVDAASIVSKLLAGAPAFPGQDVVRLATLYRAPLAGHWGGASQEHLYQQHQQGENGEGRLSLLPIRHPGLMRLLIAGTFTPSKAVNPEVRDAAIQLLALGTAGGPLPAHYEGPEDEEDPWQQNGADQGTGHYQPQHMQGNVWESAASIQESHGLKRAREAEGEEGGEGGGRARKHARGGPEGGGEGGVAGLKSIDDLFEDEEEEDEGTGRGDGHDDQHHHPQQQQEQQHQHREARGEAGTGLDRGGDQEGDARQWEGLEGMRDANAAEGRGHAGFGVADGAQPHHQQLRCTTEADRLQETQSALRCVLVVGAKAGARGLSREDVGSVQQLVSVPVAGVALLHHMRCHMGARDYYGESGAPAVADYLRLTLLVARSQPQLVQEVVDLLQCALQSMGSQRAEVAHACLGAMVHLMRDCHAVEQVMAAVDAWAKEADPSLVRHFAIQVLVSLAPPYSPAFSHWLLRHIVRSGLRRGRDMHQGTRNALLLQEFASCCLAMAEDPQTSGALRFEPKELQLLNEWLKISK